MERERTDGLLSGLKLQKMERDFDLRKERECLFCFYDLHLSAAGCQCSPDQFSCLKHANQFCSCEIDNRFVLLRYTINELNTLVEALEGGVDAIKVWTSDDSGLGSANDKVFRVAKLDDESDTYGTKSRDQRESSSCSPETEEKLNMNVPCTSYSHVSSEVIQSGSQHGSFCLSTSHISIDSHNAIINDGNLVMNNKGKVGQDCCIDLDLNVLCDENDSGLLPLSGCFDSKAISNVEETCMSNCRQENVHSSDTAREPDLLQHDSNCNLSVSHVLLNKDPLCLRDLEHTCSNDGNKLFGVDLLSLHPHSKISSDSLLKTEMVDTSDVKISTEDCSYQIRELDLCVEPINFGTLIFGKRWCSKQAIFPKGMLNTNICWVF